MFGRSPTATLAQQQPLPASSIPALAGPTTTAPSSSSLLQTISDRAASAPNTRAIPAPAPGAAPDSGYSTPSSGPVHASMNPASFRDLLASHRAVVAMFTSATCGPCRLIEPVFEELAREKAGLGRGQGQVAFAKIDLGVGLGSMVAREYNVTATPTFGFFLDGKRVRVHAAFWGDGR